MKDGNCGGCDFAMPVISDDGKPIVKCRRYPPTQLVLNGDIVQSFPDAAERCGEYRQLDAFLNKIREDFDMGLRSANELKKEIRDGNFGTGQPPGERYQDD